MTPDEIKSFILWAKDNDAVRVQVEGVTIEFRPPTEPEIQQKITERLSAKAVEAERFVTEEDRRRHEQKERDFITYMSA